MNEREYYRRLFKGEYPGGSLQNGRRRFMEEMKERNSYLFQNGVWLKHSKFGKRYYQKYFYLAPYCKGGCGKRVIAFSSWGEVNPFRTICNECIGKPISPTTE